MDKVFKSVIGLLSTVVVTSCASYSDTESLLKDKSNKTADPIEEAIQERDALILQDESLMEKRAAAVILSDYIKLEDKQYSLEISESQAAKLGISKENYQLIVEQIESSNSAIANAIIRGDDIYLMDIQDRAKSYKMPQTTIRNRSLLNASRAIDGGIIGQRYGTNSASFNVPDGIKSVILKCGTNYAALTTYTCSVTCFGKTITRSAIGSIFCTRTFEISLPASGSGVIAYLSFSSTDPNGSYCIWSLSY